MSKREGFIKFVPKKALQEVENIMAEEGLKKIVQGFEVMAENSFFARTEKKRKFGVLPRKNKKGNVPDVLTIAIFVFIIGIVVFTVNYGFDQFYDEIDTIPAINSSQVTLDAMNTSQTNNHGMDYTVFAIWIGLNLAMLILAWLVRGEPIFVFIYTLGMLIVVVVSIVLAFTWNQFSTTALFSDVLAYMPITNFILNNLHISSIVVGFVAMVIIYGKPGRE